MQYHIIAFLCGFILDLILGDPYSFPHPIRLIGNMISFFEKKLLKEELNDKKKFLNGIILVILVTCFSTFGAAILLILGYLIHPVLGVIIETIMTYQMLAIKCLRVESMKVYTKLETSTLEEARFAVSMIVGRDTKNLDKKAVARAAVETVAENTSDGIIAPMLYMAIGGPTLGFLYKSINTMDSMVGYKNDKYMYFGRAAARLDDVVNFIPARISALLMIISTLFLGKEFDIKNAFRIFKRDRYKHKSPNSAQTESVCAGALNIRLAGPTSYFGKIVEKPYIGDANREIENEDIKRANKLLYGTAFISEIICLLILALFL